MSSHINKSNNQVDKKTEGESLKFYIARRDWTVEEWKRVIFSDESPFELVQPANRQNN